MNTISVKVNSARKVNEFNEVERILLPGLTGEIEVLPDHMPLITELQQGDIRIFFKDGQDVDFLINRGYARITDNHIDLLLDEAELSKELVEEEIRKAIENAEKKMESPDLPPSELIQLEKKLRYERFKLTRVE